MLGVARIWQKFESMSNYQIKNEKMTTRP